MSGRDHLVALWRTHPMLASLRIWGAAACCISRANPRRRPMIRLARISARGQTLLHRAAVETLSVFVMLWASWVYLESFDPVALQPSLKSLCHDLGPVVRADRYSGAPHSRIAFYSRASTSKTLTIYRRIRIICSAVHRFFVVDDIPFFDRRKSSHLM